jgi:hypothetical protein
MHSNTGKNTTDIFTATGFEMHRAINTSGIALIMEHTASGRTNT